MSRRTKLLKRASLEVDPALYQGATRDERREIARAWTVINSLDRAKLKGFMPKVPDHLYACGRCHQRLKDGEEHRCPKAVA